MDRGPSDREFADADRASGHPAGADREHRDSIGPDRVSGHVTGEQARLLDPAEADYQEHDRYFRVRRTRHAPARTFFAGLVTAQQAVTDNARAHGLSPLSEDDFPQLRAGLDDLVRYIGLTTPPGPAGTPLRTPAGDTSETGTPAHNTGTAAAATPTAERWLLGHQLFFVLMQGVITGLNCFLRASAIGDEPDARAALRVAASFMRSSAAAFRFTSDFSTVDYEQLIRPAMAPPAVQAGFSGLQTRDHAHLMTQFAEVRVMHIKIGPARLGDAFEDLVEATVAAYEAHQLICARFGGDVLPSLRMAARSGGRSTAPGVQVVRQMMRARLFTLGGAARDGGREPTHDGGPGPARDGGPGPASDGGREPAGDGGEPR